jgi:hypothetical protein
MEAGTVPEKVTISHRGERYEIGMGKRYYAIWAVGAPRTDPLDRWPETPEGWSQAWARFTAIETPGTISAVPRTSALSALRGIVGRAAARGSAAGPDGDDAGRSRRASVTRLVAAAFLGIGVLLGIAGLFPAYFTGQSVASTSEQLVPHLLYLATWAAAAVLIVSGKARARIGALLGTGLSAVTFGLFVSDLATGMSEHAGVGPGMVISLIGWLASTAGAILALSPRSPAGAAGGPAMAVDASPPGTAAGYGTPTSVYGAPAPVYGTAGPAYGGGPYGGPAPAAARAGIFRFRKSDAGTVALLTLCAIGAAASFVPSWDSYTIVQSATGTSATQTAGNAFQNAGTVIFGDIACVVAVIGVAFLAGLWRPARHGAALLGGVIVAMAGQAISALIQVSQPASPALFGLSNAQAQANGLSVSSGVTSIFWVFCLFVIAMALACAWLVTTPSVAPSPGPASNPAQPNPGPGYPAPGYQAEAQSPASSESDDEESSPAEDGALTDTGVTEEGPVLTEDRAHTEDAVLTKDPAVTGDPALMEGAGPSTEGSVPSETGHTDDPNSTSSEVSTL